VILEVRIPDIGTEEKVDVVEVLVAPGDRVEKDDGLITLESDKASMDVPSPAAGKVSKIQLKVGDQVGEGDLILTLDVDKAVAEEEAVSEAGGAETPTVPGPSVQDPATGADERHEPPRERRPPSAPSSRPSEVATAFDTEVAVLGGGVGGYTAAFRAADLGKRVTLIERYPVLGGVCLNVGCIPSKALLHVAKVIDEAAALKSHGVSFGDPEIDLDGLRRFKGSVVERLTGGLSMLAKKRKVEVLHGAAHFTGAHELEIASTEGVRSLTFESAIVAAGSRVVEIPGIPHDDPRVMHSTDALTLPEIPERLLLVGGGIIGLEMAMVYGALGSKLTVVELLDGLIPGCDRDLVRPLERRLRKELGATVYLETRVNRIEAEKRELIAHLEGPKAPETLEFDRVLVAVGRRPNGDRLNAEAAGIRVDERGFLPVDRQMRTQVPHIFAVGDIVGEPMLAHKATHEGKVAGEVAAGLESSFDARVIPSVAYTDPEIAWVGLTETEAERKGLAFEKSSFPWAASGRSLGMGRNDGKTKLLFDPGTRRVLGAGIVGPHAGDLIAEVALAIEMDCEASDLGLTVHPHPTLSETIAFAAEVFEGTATDVFAPKRTG
jgi:dihydrolipoamide dehydrogenase